MGPLAIGGILDGAIKVLDRVLPDQAERDKARLEVLKLAQAGEFKVIDATVELSRQQTAINQVEAGSSSLFVSGWRPFIGWVAGVALAAQYIVVPLFSWIAAIYGLPLPPKFDFSDLLTLLFAMLGFGAMRTVERFAAK